MIRYIFPDYNDIYNLDIILSLGMLGILVILALSLFTYFTSKVLKKSLYERKEKYKVMYMGIRQIMNMSEDTFFGLDITTGVVVYSDNMEPRFGWHFPNKLTRADREDPARAWQIYEEDEDILRRMYTDVCYEAKNVTESLRILNVNRDYIKCKVHLRPVLDRKNNVIYLVGNIVHD